MRSRASYPYIFKNFNVRGYYVTSGITNIICRVIHALVEALNERAKMPKYVLVVADKDYLDCILMKFGNEGISMMLGATLHASILQIDQFFKRRHTDLQDKKPGAVIGSNYPKIIWVRMLKRPVELTKQVFTLRGKFNTILEECLHDGKKDDHLIMSIEVQTQDFDVSGGLTRAGQAIFWKEVIKAMEKLDTDKISLKPRKMNQTGQAENAQSQEPPPKKISTHREREHSPKPKKHWSPYRKQPSRNYSRERSPHRRSSNTRGHHHFQEYSRHDGRRHHSHRY